MSPYRTAAASSPAKGWIGRFTTNIYGDLVIRYYESRWLWVLRLRAAWFIESGNGFELVEFQRLEGSDFRAVDRKNAEKYDRIVILD